ncbi:MAG: aryl-sulfate sulfotransferase, partial [Bacteroidetes bacterium]|nr:aryl-sulfate sulfotransferase [Bacteroidota bacterium]
IAILLSGLLSGASASAQGAFEGYTLFNPNNSRTTYLVDLEGRTVHTWQHGLTGGYSVYLLPDGSLLRPASIPNATLRGAAGSGLIQRVSWEGDVLWSYQYSGSTYIAHHDIEPMPNGNVLLIAWEVKTRQEALAAGRANAQMMWPDHIVEVRPEGSSGGNIVWEWHAWDHLVQDRDVSKPNYGSISDHPELIDVNLISNSMMPGGGDWLHINGISYNPEDDLIVISSHFMNEFYVIDHSTTTEEAKGHSGGRHGRGGDILYRWGNPANYGAAGSRVFDVVHCSAWIPGGYPGAGNILAFNNASRARASVIVEVTPPRDGQGTFLYEPGQAFGPESPVWTYSAGSSFFSNHLGGNQRLPNGNTLLTEATSGDLREVTAEGSVVWEYHYGREIARSLRYASDFSGVAALNPTAVDPAPETRRLRACSTPNPFQHSTVIAFETSFSGQVELHIHDALGRTVRRMTAQPSARSGRLTWDGGSDSGLPTGSGIYYYRLLSGGHMLSGKLIRLE